MPEGDTVLRLARSQASLVGRTVERIELRVGSLATVDLAGERIERVWPHGKHLFWQIGGHVLHTHLRMEGKWRVHRVGTRWSLPAHTARVVVQVTGGIELVGHELGIVELFPAAEFDARMGWLGPDILADDWVSVGRAEALRRVTANPSLPIGDAILDQRNVAGIGNEYRAEVCFLRGIHPGTAVGQIDAGAVLDLAAKLMRGNLDSPVRTFTGDRRPGHTTFVFGRNHRPCRRCGTTIVSGTQGVPERMIWWCPACQLVTV